MTGTAGTLSVKHPGWRANDEDSILEKQGIGIIIRCEPEDVSQTTLKQPNHKYSLQHGTRKFNICLLIMVQRSSFWTGVEDKARISYSWKSPVHYRALRN